MAQHSDQKPVAMEKMMVPESLLVCRSGAGGQPSFVITCDGKTLRWLAGSFRALDQGKPFRLGDGPPLRSDGKCVVTVAASSRQKPAGLTRLGAGSYQWVLPVTQASRYAGLITGMADFHGPCHQHLDAESQRPVVLVTKEEYDAATLRKMRSAAD
jgi:hypothetical protein